MKRRAPAPAPAVASIPSADLDGAALGQGAEEGLGVAAVELDGERDAGWVGATLEGLDDAL